MAAIGLAVVSDRGDLYLPRCLDTLEHYVQPMSAFKASVTVDDRDHELGMAGAVRRAWGDALQFEWDYLLHVEEDFVFTTAIDLDALVYVLQRAPYLAQIVLKRQPWSPPELAAGGIVEQDPDAYTECHCLRHSAVWTEHQRIFSLNPCLIPRHVVEMGWPDGNEAEFTTMCLDAGLRFAFYGAKLAPPLVEHVGVVRAQGWRL